VRTTEELLEGKVAAAVYKTEINDRGNPLCWARDSLYPQKLALTSPTSGGRSVGIFRSRTKATEFSFRPIRSTKIMKMTQVYDMWTVNILHWRNSVTGTILVMALLLVFQRCTCQL
jgi:hypothetical protein